MIDLRRNEIAIVGGLKDYINANGGRPCEVVRQNQVSAIPPYPYISYAITTPAAEAGGTYSVDEDGTYYRSVIQTWSYTTQSDDQDEALTLACYIRDYFTASGLIHLADNRITVRRVRDITTRDNLISIQYEYRCGLDVTFGIPYTITPTQEMRDNVIDTATIKEV